MVAHPLAVHQVHDQCSARGEGSLDGVEHRQIVFKALEVAERIAEDADAVELAVAKPEAPRIALVERDLKTALLGAFAG